MIARGDDVPDDFAFVFRLHAPGSSPGDIGREIWHLPALTIRVETDAGEPTVTRQDDQIEVRYGARSDGAAPREIVLRMEEPR